MRYRLMQAAAVLAVAGALVAAPARAQESAAGDTASEPDGIIVVTAQKRAENLQDVPVKTAQPAVKIAHFAVEEEEDE